MAVTFEELQNSPTISDGSNSSATRRYLGEGSSDYAEVLTEAKSQLPTTFGSLTRSDVDVEPLGRDDLWIATARFKFPQLAEPDETSAPIRTFSVRKETQNIKNAIATIQGEGEGMAAIPDVGTLINVSEDGVAGVDIATKIQMWTETHYFDPADVTLAYEDTLNDLVDTVNDATFRGRPAGTVKFEGYQGGERVTGVYEITFEFAYSKPKTGIVIGSLNSVDKNGWEYLWVWYRPEVHSGTGVIIQVPRAVYVQQIFEDGDFSLLGI